jgi:hypothetical protein
VECLGTGGCAVTGCKKSANGVGCVIGRDRRIRPRASQAGSFPRMASKIKKSEGDRGRQTSKVCRSAKWGCANVFSSVAQSSDSTSASLKKEALSTMVSIRGDLMVDTRELVQLLAGPDMAKWWMRTERSRMFCDRSSVGQCQIV